MQSPIRHPEESHDHRRRTPGSAEPRSRRLSSTAAVATDIALAALGAALIVFSGRISALDAGVAILVLIAAAAATATRLIQAARGRVALGVYASRCVRTCGRTCCSCSTTRCSPRSS